jgi:hypothetical protein
LNFGHWDLFDICILGFDILLGAMLPAVIAGGKVKFSPHMRWFGKEMLVF